MSGGAALTLHVDCQLPTTNCQVPTANCQLPTVNCQLPTVKCQLPTAKCQLLTTTNGYPRTSNLSCLPPRHLSDSAQWSVSASLLLWVQEDFLTAAACPVVSLVCMRRAKVFSSYLFLSAQRDFYETETRVGRDSLGSKEERLGETETTSGASQDCRSSSPAATRPELGRHRHNTLFLGELYVRAGPPPLPRLPYSPTRYVVGYPVSYLRQQVTCRREN
ncbi:hypothetical protein C0Q70_18372 [Pomacea canaliculata]|uniref:Uncharacterized protein n=1 Tax=Pomacea canaliculata TaxID=400727 RepID=A0A2T7NN25_POMCA|nr:hypothetical protein C0Q70_18372 [Pomacea canaliculata]